MNQFTVEMKVIPGGPTWPTRPILHPQTRELWAIEGSEGHEGEVFALNLETEKFRSLGGRPYTGRPASVTPYWNSVTQRVGMFGGYGYFAVTNERREFDSTTGRCVQIEPDHDGPGPWRRRLINIPLVPDANRRRIFVVGGLGSPSGKQGQMVRGLKCFDGRFHYLDDIWELDMERNAWRCLLSPGHLDPERLQAAVFFPRLGGLVIFEGMKLGNNKPELARAWLLRPNRDRLPVRLPSEGEPSRLTKAWSWALDPRNDELLMFADDGIFRVSVEPARSG